MEKTNKELKNNQNELVNKNEIIPVKEGKKNEGLLSLTLMRFATILTSKVKFWTFIVITLLVAALSLAALAILDTKSSDAYDSLNLIILFNTLLIVGLGVLLSTAIFRSEINNHLVSLEQREGYKNRDIFGSRLIEVSVEAAVFMIFQIIVNMIVIGAFNQFDSVLWYKTYIITLGWYAIMLVIGIAIGIFFSSFSIISVARTVSAAILILGMLFGYIGGATNIGRDNNNPFDNSLVTLKMVRNSRMNDFAENQLKLHNNWVNSEQDIYTKWSEGSGSDQKLVIDNFNDKYKNWIQRYQEINGKSSIQDPDDISSLLGAMNAFGGHILSEAGWKNVSAVSSQLSEFLKDTDKYFDKDFSLKFKYTDIMDWNNLGTVGLGQHDYDDDYDGYLLKENLQRIFKEMQSSWYAKKYKVVDYLKDISDSSTLNIMGIYPDFCSWSSSGFDNDYKDLRNDVENTKVNPAEIIYNKYVFWALVQSQTNVVPFSNYEINNSKSSIHVFPKANEAHRTAIGMIWDPLIQFSQMWDGVNYRNILLNDVLNSKDTIMGGSRTTIKMIYTKSTLDGNGQLVSYQREAHVEPVYVGWFIIGCLLVFASYWIYKRKIVQ